MVLRNALFALAASAALAAASLTPGTASAPSTSAAAASSSSSVERAAKRALIGFAAQALHFSGMERAPGSVESRLLPNTRIAVRKLHRRSPLANRSALQRTHGHFALMLAARIPAACYARRSLKGKRPGMPRHFSDLKQCPLWCRYLVRSGRASGDPFTLAFDGLWERGSRMGYRNAPLTGPFRD
jgi:hypothetical protein